MGFAIQRYGAARIAWTTKDGMKHEKIIDLKQALPGSVGGAEVWFKIGDHRVEVVVRGPGEAAPNVREERKGNEKN